MTPAIHVNQLCKRFKGQTLNAVDHISFDIQQGEIFGLLGPNGAGKTTTINMLCGLIHMDSGDININGYHISQLDQIKLQTGFVPQQNALFPKLTAFENLYYFAALYNIKKNQAIERINDLLNYFELHQHATKLTNTFSGGMKRRLNLIAALIHNPKILILDEPTSGVDVQSRSMIINYLKSYASQGNAVLYTSHLLDEAQQLCSYIGIIDHGRMVIQGQPEQLIADLGNSSRLDDLFIHYTGYQVRD